MGLEMFSKTAWCVFENTNEGPKRQKHFKMHTNQQNHQVNLPKSFFCTLIEPANNSKKKLISHCWW